MLKVTSFVESDYYGKGSITVEYEGREFLIENNFCAKHKKNGGYDHSGLPGTYTGNTKEVCKVIHSMTFFLEDECSGWDPVKKMFYTDWDYAAVFECDEQNEYQTYITNPDHEDIQWLTKEEMYEHRLDQIRCQILDVEEFEQVIMDHINGVINAERDEIVKRLAKGIRVKQEA